jgi:protocadherin delta 1
VPFSVSSNGEIKATTAFDREEDSSFIFEIVATDQGLPPLSSTIFVRVFIIDENDNKPTITHPNSINSTIIVSYFPVAGTYLTTIKASDADENGQNSLLHFELVTGNEDDIFTIGKTSGKIYLKRPYEAKSK